MPKITYTKKDLIDIIYKKVTLPKNKIKIMVDIILDSMGDIFKKNREFSKIIINQLFKIITAMGTK